MRTTEAAAIALAPKLHTSARRREALKELKAHYQKGAKMRPPRGLQGLIDSLERRLNLPEPEKRG
jgi:hypothetical protein